MNNDETLSIIVKLQDDASAGLESMASKVSSVGESIGASIKNVGDKITDVGAKMTAFGSKMQSAGQSMSIGLTAPIVALGTAIVETSMKFQASMEMISTQAGAGQAEVDKMTKAVLALAKSGETGQGPQALADGLFHIESLGYRGAEALDVLKTSADAADIGLANMEDVSNALGAALVTGISGAQTASQAMGTLNATIGAGNMKMQDLANALGTGILPAAKNFGLTLTDVGAALATLTDNGMGADEAATRLRMTFSLLAAPSKKATEAFASIGLTQLQLADDMRGPNGLMTAINDLNKHMNEVQPATEVIVKGTKMSAAQMDALKTKIADAQEKLRILNETHIAGATTVNAHGKALKTAAQNLNSHTVAVDNHNLAVKKLTEQITGYQDKLKGANTVLETTGGKMLDASQKAALLSEAFGGGRSSAAILTLTEQADRLGTKYTQITANAKDFAAAVEATHETNQFKLNAALAEMQVTLIDIGGSVMPLFSEALKKMSKVLEEFSGWWDKLNPSTQSWIVKGLALVAVLGPILLIMGSLITAFGTITTLIGGFISAIGSMVQGISMFAMANPILAAVTLAILAIGLIVYEVIKHWDAIKRVAIEVWSSIARFFESIWAGMRNVAMSVWSGIASFFTGLWNGIKNVFKFAIDVIVGLVVGAFGLMGINIVQVFTNITKFFTETWSAIKQLFQQSTQAIGSVWTNAWNGIRVFVSTIWTQIKADVLDGFDWLVQKFSAIVDPITKAWNGLWSSLTAGVMIAWNAVEQTIKNAINWIIGKINDVINGINAVAEKGASVLGLGNHAPQIPNIPMLAEGGIVNKATLAIIGEAGPEAVVPLSQMGNFGSGNGGGHSIVVNIINPSVRNNGDIQSMRKMIDQALRPLLVNTKIAHT